VNPSVARLTGCLLALLMGGTTLAAEDIRLATTTSTENSGLLNYLLPRFEARYGGKVRVIAVGTGTALKIGEKGDADVLLVHAAMIARAEREQAITRRFTRAHPSVPVATVAAQPVDIHDIDGLRTIGEVLVGD